MHVELWEFEQQNHILCFVLFFVHVPEVVAALQRETQQQHFQDISHVMTTVPVSLLLCSRLSLERQSAVDEASCV